MNHIGTKTMETNRLILRRFNKNDSDDAFINMGNLMLWVSLYAKYLDKYLKNTDLIKRCGN